MPQPNLFVYFLSILISQSVRGSVLSNLCPDSPSCNCILTDQTALEILCNAILSPSELPTLTNNTLQAGVTSLRVDSATVGTSGPLTSLPTNICSAYPNIAVLDLSSNAITGFLNTSELACLGSNLISVDFSNNQINGTDRNFFTANRRLQTIDLSSNQLKTMPTIDGEYFINFTPTMTSMNFSHNQIINADLWPLFVKIQHFMVIDMSNNLISNFTNTAPVYVKQFTETPDPRIFYLNNNQVQRLSDLLLEQYGACATVSYTSTAYFIVGISNLLLTNNPLICDCESYHLLKFINDRINDFPLIYNNSALINQAKCAAPTSMIGQSYLFANFSQSNACDNYTLPQISDAFCSVYTNASNSTIPPPTYLPTATTIFSTITNGNGTVTEPGGGTGGSNNDDGSGTKTSGSPSWYIILGIVLGLIILLFFLGFGCFLCKDRLLPARCRSKLGNNVHNLNDSYESIIRHSELSSQTAFPLNGMNPRRASISTSTGGTDDDGTSRNGNHYWNDQVHPEQETQTCFQIVRSKPSSNAPPRINRNPQRITNTATHNSGSMANMRRGRKTSSSTPTTAATSTTNVVKGIPIASASTKNPPILPNGSDTQPDTSTSELSMITIPLTPSKRATLLPPLKSGIYIDSTNTNLLNTSASANLTNQRQRRLSSSWTQRRNRHFPTPPSVRPQSMGTSTSAFNQDSSSDEEALSIPTVESSTNKSSKPLRTLPLLNITVMPAWIDDQK